MLNYRMKQLKAVGYNEVEQKRSRFGREDNHGLLL